MELLFTILGKQTIKAKKRDYVLKLFKIRKRERERE